MLRARRDLLGGCPMLSSVRASRPAPVQPTHPACIKSWATWTSSRLPTGRARSKRRASCFVAAATPTASPTLQEAAARLRWQQRATDALSAPRPASTSPARRPQPRNDMPIVEARGARRPRAGVLPDQPRTLSTPTRLHAHGRNCAERIAETTRKNGATVVPGCASAPSIRVEGPRRRSAASVGAASLVAALPEGASTVTCLTISVRRIAAPSVAARDRARGDAIDESAPPTGEAPNTPRSDSSTIQHASLCARE